MQKQSKSYSTELKVGTKIIDSSNTYQRIVSNAISRKNSTILASKANIGKVICKFCEQLFASSTNHTTNACNKYIINNPLKFAERQSNYTIRTLMDDIISKIEVNYNQDVNIHNMDSNTNINTYNNMHDNNIITTNNIDINNENSIDNSMITSGNNDIKNNTNHNIFNNVYNMFNYNLWS